MNYKGIVAIKRETLEYIYDCLIDYEDVGPVGEGWHSDELLKIIKEVEDILETPAEKRWGSV